MRTGRHAVGRHAIDAAEIALVGNGNAQVVDIAAKAIMLHEPVHAALPSCSDLFFGKHNTPREEWVDMRTTGQVASSKTDFPSPSSTSKPSQKSMIFFNIEKSIDY